MPTAHQAARLTRATALWGRADEAIERDQVDEAFRLLTRAHDLVTDMQIPHRDAHARLLPVEERLGLTRDARASRGLLRTQRFGVFGVLAVYFSLAENYARFDPADD